MNIDDYKRTVNQMHINPKLEKEIINMGVTKENKKHINKKKFIPILAAAALSCTALTAAFADDIIGIFKKTDNFEINISSTDLLDTDVQSVPLLNAVPKVWDEETIAKLFSDGKQVTDSDEYPSDYDSSRNRKWFGYSDGSNVVYEDGELLWRSGQEFGDYSYSLALCSYATSHSGLSDDTSIFTKDEIEGLDKDASVNIADNIVKTLGLSVGKPTVISFDAESLIKTDTARNENGERIDKHENILPEWTKEQEAYLIVYDLNVGNVFDSGENAVINGLGTDGSAVSVIVSRNGIEYFDAEPIYDVTDVSDETVNICSAETAADTVLAQYQQYKNDYPTIVKNCRLVYLPEESGKACTLKPYWAFYSTKFITWKNESGTDSSMDYCEAIFVDAQTGKLRNQNL